jgi:hypothetical protein
MEFKPARAFRVDCPTLRSLRALSDRSRKSERACLVDDESGIASSESNLAPLAGFETNGGAPLLGCLTVFFSPGRIRTVDFLYFDIYAPLLCCPDFLTRSERTCD